MASTDVTLTTRKPKPPQADFAFYVDFNKEKGPASRVFAATHQFIKACERLDRELVTSIDINIETVMVLEDIEAASLKTWLRSELQAADDQAIRDLDWKPLVSKYLVRAKYLILRWIDEDEAPKDLLSLGREIQNLAAETDVRHIPDYTPPQPGTLINEIKDFEEVKDHLVEGDEASMLLSDEESANFNLSIRLDIEDIEALAVREVLTHSVQSMVMIVKKPDYLGASMWELRHGKQALLARMEDEEWLRKFQSRDIDVRPGDALNCAVRIDMYYGHDNELVSQKFYVSKVHAVLENQYKSQISLLDEKGGQS